MEKHTNIFKEGMNTDWSKISPHNQTYLLAKDFRLITEEGTSTFSLETVKGNKLSFTIPDPGTVVRIVLDDVAAALPANVQLTINAAPQTVAGPFSSPEDLYKTVSDFINVPANYPGLTLRSQFDESGIIFWSDAYLTLTASSTTVEVDVTISSAASTDPIIVGHTTIYDTIILFTETSVSSQIWKVTIDRTTEAATVKLIRNRADSFSVLFPIEAVGRYEQSNIQKAYWVDDLNAVRKINIESISSMLDLIDLDPAITYGLPIAQEIIQSGGVLAPGIYQYAYRLFSVSGSESEYSRASSPFNVVTDSELTDNYGQYQGAQATDTTGKALKYKIENIDPNFDGIEIVAIYKSSDTAAPIITQFIRDSLSGESTFEFTHTGSEQNVVDVTPEEFLLPGTIFTTAKTLDIKDNRLFVANTTGGIFDVGVYDAEAFRYPQSAAATSNGYEATVDKKNPYNKDSSRYPATEVSATQDKHQVSSLILGGTGTNIDFNFVTKQLILDKAAIDQAESNTPGVGDDIVDNIKGMVDQTINGFTYPMGAGFENYKNPFVASAFRGYTRSEVYRFGIVFYSLKGVPSLVKWIADIRMPEHYDVPAFSIDYRALADALGVNFDVTIPDAIKSKISGFSIVRSKRTNDDKTIVANGLCGDVWVNENRDATGFGHHYINSDRLVHYAPLVLPGLARGTSIDKLRMQMPDIIFNGTTLTGAYTIRPHTGLTPLAVDIDAAGNTKASVVKTADYGTYGKYYDPSGDVYTDISAADNIGALSATTGVQFPLGRGSQIFEAPFNAGSYHGYLNFGFHTNGDDDFQGNGGGTAEYEFGMIGNEGHIFELPAQDITNLYETLSRILPIGTMLPIGTPPPITGIAGEWNVLPNEATLRSTYARRLYAALYKELSNQYGGDTKSSIDESTYISTGHFQTVAQNDGINDYTCEIWGGDTFLNAYDAIRHAANVSTGSEYYKAAANEARLMSPIFPCETTTNVELRIGEHFSTNGTGYHSGSANPINGITVDTYGFNSAYNRENDTEFYISSTEFQNSSTEFPNRIWASDVKINGEVIDSWTVFRPNNFLDVDGNYGEINKIINFNDKFYFHQDKAFGGVAINPRSQIVGDDGISVELGTGGILHDYDYISTSVGCKHRFSVVPTPSGLYWFDMYTRDIFRFGANGLNNITETKGLRSFMKNNIDNNLFDTDSHTGGMGIHGTYDFENSEVLMTFIEPHSFIESQFGGTFVIGDRTKHSATGLFYVCINDVTEGAFFDPSSSDDWLLIDIGNDFTLSFSEAVGKFSGLYSFVPKAYVNARDLLLSADPSNDEDVYLHNVGDYTKFYTVVSDPIVHILVNPYPQERKVFDAVKYYANTKKDFFVNLDDETFSQVKMYNDYQHTGAVTLTEGDTVKYMEKKWQLHIPRNVIDQTLTDPNIFHSSSWDVARDRMRDNFLIQEYTFANPNSRKLVLNYVENYFRVSHR